MGGKYSRRSTSTVPQRCIRARTKFARVVVIGLGCHPSPRVASQAVHNYHSVRSKVSSDPFQGLGRGGDYWDAGSC